MKRMIWPSASWTSFSTAFSRSSNSPRYLEPATSAPTSSAITRRSRSDSGTSPSTIRWARPSTIAVLPTPGSPISTGLFLVRRESTWITRRISSSRPITGSSLFCRASAVRSRPNFSSASAISSAFGEVTRLEPWVSSTARASESRSGRMSATPLAGSASARSRWPTEMYSSPRAAISRSARWSTLMNALDGRTSGCSPVTVGSSATALRARSVIAGTSAESLRSAAGANPSSCSSSATSRWAGVSSELCERGGELLGGRDRLVGLDRESVSLHRPQFYALWTALSRNLSLSD